MPAFFPARRRIFRNIPFGHQRANQNTHDYIRLGKILLADSSENPMMVVSSTFGTIDQLASAFVALGCSVERLDHGQLRVTRFDNRGDSPAA